MLDLQKLVIDRFMEELLRAYKQMYSIREPDYGNIVAWAGQLALENISNSDALYHNLDHTIMVTMVGQAILRGKHLCDGGIAPRDWFHFVLALLLHDIGYVKGICRRDSETHFATGIGDETVEIPYGGTDVAMTPYHVDRSKLFVQERFGGKLLIDVDAELVASIIEMTRFPVPDDGDQARQETNSYGGLLRAADFIGQLGDPNYLQKIPALFYEFEKTGSNKRMGYTSPDDMRRSFARFYWDVVSPYLKDALRYLQLTHEGKQWVANLHAHVFNVEHNRV